MSTKPAHNISSDAEQTLDTAKLHSWDVHTITGHYLSMDFIMSDAKSNVIHSTAKANVAHNFLKLKEGSVYSIKNIVVQANKEEYRIFKDHAYMIEFDGAMSVRKTSVKGALLLILDSGGLGDALVERKTNNVGLYPVVLTAMNVKLYSNKLYLSSGSSTQILEDPQIPELKALRAENSLRPSNAESRLMASGQEKGWNFLSCGGEKCKKGIRRKEGGFWCEACNKAVEYPMLRFKLELDVSDKTASTVVVMFNEPATELVKCSADSLVEADEDVGLAYADYVGLPRSLANTISTTQMLEIKSHTYYEHGTFESFTCWRIAPKEVVEEDAGSSNVNASAEVNIKEFQRLAMKSSVATPLKPAEERGKKVQSNSTLRGHTNIEVDLEDSNDEVISGMDDGQADARDISVLNKRKKKRYVVDDSASE
ncbi:reverse transcriptase domain-containing protein [Tanacetum coccineum]